MCISSDILLQIVHDVQCMLCEGSWCSSFGFKCTNGKCISKLLMCDRINHCVDNSDESSASCC